jgi:glycyl-tRNA synthetase
MNIDHIASFAKSKGFIFHNSTIYGIFKGTFDYGPLGCEIKQNILKSYRNYFIIPNENIVQQDGAIISSSKVWKASGHLDNFNDPVAINSRGERCRADHLIQDSLSTEIMDVIFPEGQNIIESLSCEQLLSIIKEEGIVFKDSPIICVEPANLMFQTTALNGTECYLRPETCQNIFMNAKLIAEIGRLSLPFGIAQHGKVFRNEIAPRNFIFRCREFEQLELEYFFNPSIPQNKNDANNDADDTNNIEISCCFSDGITRDINVDELKEIIHFEHVRWIKNMLIWLTSKTFGIGLKKENLRLREHTEKELAHYSSSTFDIEYKYPFGSGEIGEFKEMCGIANRGNFDISQHAKHSKKNLKFKCPVTNDTVYPHVIEPSIGIERLFLAIICDAYDNSYKDTKGKDYEVLHFNENISPVQYAIFPLPSKKYPKEEFIKKAKYIQKELMKINKTTFYDDGGSIGRRYARQDGIGTKWCITVDETTLENGTFTIRERDTKYQRRIAIETLLNIPGSGWNYTKLVTGLSIGFSVAITSYYLFRK